MTLYVNLYAAPGAGKSTVAANVYGFLKLSGVNTELVREYAKDQIWQETEATLAYPIYVFAKQYHAMARLRGKVEVVVSDSPLMLSLWYALPRHRSKAHRDKVAFGVVPPQQPFALDEFAALVRAEHNLMRPSYDFWIERLKGYLQAGRGTTEAEAIQMDVDMRAWLADEDVTPIPVPGDHDAARTIGGLVLRDLCPTCRGTASGSPFPCDRHKLL